MAVLGTYTATSVQTLANGTNCIAHGLNTTPDWAACAFVAAAGAGILTPVSQIARNATSVNYTNPGGNAGSEVIAQFCHSIIR